MIEEYATGAIRWRRSGSAQYVEYQVWVVDYIITAYRGRKGCVRRREWRAV